MAFYASPLPYNTDWRGVAYHNGKLAYVHYSDDLVVPDAVKIICFDTKDGILLPLDMLGPVPAGPVQAMALSDSFFSCILGRYV